MKKPILTFIIAITTSLSGMSQEQQRQQEQQGDGNNICSSHVHKKSGPGNTSQLTKLLNTSINPVLAKLSEATKKSLIENFVFAGGQPVAMNGPDENIELLYKTNAVEVFSAILGIQVIVCTFDTKPIIKDITYAEFQALLNSNPDGRLFVDKATICQNCSFDSHGGACCVIPGYGCWDKFTEISNQRGVYYHVGPPGQ